ncbi:MAG: hypothetical protein M1836_006316 [Candelina mexicana]|nr:MAG: hypothetical protein M1836_006316 [Candelina mexicana]
MDGVCRFHRSPLARASANWTYSAPPDQNQAKPAARRLRTDEPSTFHDISSRRPSLFTRGSSTIPDDIVLGPPKTTFASATSTRNTNKPIDSPDRRSFHNHSDDTSKNERLNLRDKFFKERNRDDTDHERPKETRNGVNNGRRGGKEECEGWTDVRPRKSFGQEEGERLRRKTGDRDSERERDHPRDFHDRSHKLHDSHSGRDREHEEKDVPPRRNGFGRGRNEPTWFKDEKTTDARERDRGKEDSRDKEWRENNRRGNRGSDREWTRGGKVELDPEWMGSADSEERTQAHTQEDFQRWKERMKAGSAVAEEKPKAVEEGDSDHQRHVSTNTPIAPTVQKVDTPLVMDPGVDKFFGLFKEPRKATEGPPSGGASIVAKKELAKGATGKSSRFTSFFAPQEEAPPQQLERAPASLAAISQDSSSEDKEGFQRILQMLGGVNMTSGDNIPPANQLQQQQPPPPANNVTKRSDPPTTAPSPFQAQKPKNLELLNPEAHTRVFKPNGLDGLLGLQTPNGGENQNRDSEFLLKLMQQSRSSAGSGQPQSAPEPPAVSRAPSTQRYAEILSRPKDTTKGKLPTGPPPGLFDESSSSRYQRPIQDSVQEASKLKATTRPPHGFSEDAAIAAFQRPQRENTSAPAKGSHTRRPPPGLFDDPSISSFPRRQPLDYLQTHQSNPVILQRPPGLEQGSSGWPNPPHQAQHQAHVPPPPGFSNPAQGSTHFPPGFPIPGPMPMYGDRGPVGAGTGPTGPGRGQVQGAQPNMGPSIFPHYGGGPPPGFHPIAFTQESIGPMPNSILHSAGSRRPQYEMFGEGGNMGPSGRGAPPGQYRRYP